MKKKYENQYSGLTVYYSNELARMTSKFTLEEEKVVHLIFSQINPYQKNPTNFKLNKLDFFDKLELESNDRYPRYRKLVHGLINKTFLEIKEEDGTHLMGVVITGSKWYARQPFFEVKLNDWFMPFIEQLIREFTKVNLDSVLKLKSKHSLTIYKLLCSWTDENKQLNQRYITTKDLKELLGLSINTYVQNDKFHRPSFERETIKKAVNEINKVSNIILNFKKNYKHGKVLNYEFIWRQKQAVTKNKIKDDDVEFMSQAEIKQILSDFDKW